MHLELIKQWILCQMFVILESNLFTYLGFTTSFFKRGGGGVCLKKCKPFYRKQLGVLWLTKFSKHNQIPENVLHQNKQSRKELLFWRVTS